MVEALSSRELEMLAQEEESSGVCQVPRLWDMAKRTIIRNIHMIDDIGEIPYDFMRSMLLKIENPEQLARLEENSPQVAEESGEIWKRLIQRDFQDGMKLVPSGIDFRKSPPKGWHHLYKSIKRKADAILADDEEKLRATLSNFQADKKARETVFNASVSEPGRRKRGEASSPSFRNMPKGKAAIMRARQNTRDMAQQRSSTIKPNALNRPRPQATIVKAPNSMVSDYQRANAFPTLRESGSNSGATSIRAPSRRATESGLAAREARLRDIAAGRRPQPSSSTSASTSAAAAASTRKAASKPTTNERPTLDHSKIYRTSSPMKRPAPASPAPRSSTPSSVSTPSAAQTSTGTSAHSKTAASGSAAIKRKRPAPNAFMPQKKR